MISVSICLLGLMQNQFESILLKPRPVWVHTQRCFTPVFSFEIIAKIELITRSCWNRAFSSLLGLPSPRAPHFLSDLAAAAAAHCSKEFPSCVDLVSLEAGSPAQNISMEILTPAFFGPCCSYFCR